jgi:hypothetical protein
MSKYRIVEVKYYDHSRFEVHKRLFGFLWWINPYSGEYSIGSFSTFDEALEIASKRVAVDNHKITKEVVWES